VYLATVIRVCMQTTTPSIIEENDEENHGTDIGIATRKVSRATSYWNYQTLWRRSRNTVKTWHLLRCWGLSLGVACHQWWHCHMVLLFLFLSCVSVAIANCRPIPVIGVDRHHRPWPSLSPTTTVTFDRCCHHCLFALPCYHLLPLVDCYLKLPFCLGHY